MRIIDITRTIQEAPIYPGSEPVEITKTLDMANGDEYNESFIKAGCHMGTHADAFCHFLAESDVSIDKMPLESYCGNCRVISVPESELITLEDIRGRLEGAERIVLHTGGSTYLCEEAAEYIAACGVKLVVTDAWSVAPLDNEGAIHRIFAESGVAIVENTVLDGVEDGEYLIFAFPAKYGGSDGAPVRAVLVTR
jgi:arylformamidase